MPGDLTAGVCCCSSRAPNETATVLTSRCDEGTAGVDDTGGVVQVPYFEAQLAGQALRLFRVDQRYAHRQVEDLARCQADLTPALRLYGSLAEEGAVCALLLSLVDEFQAVHVLVLPVRVLAIQGAVPGDVERQQRTPAERPDEGADHHQQRRRIAHQARPEQSGATALQCMFGGIADQPARVAHPVHHAVADVGAGAATDAVQLQAVADVDAGGADLHAQGAIDAVAQALSTRIAVLAAGAAAFT